MFIVEVKPAEATAGTYYCTGSIAHPNHSGLQQNTTTPTNNNTTTQLSVIKMNWLDTDTYPLEKADLILGSDLVYDASILTCLVPAICSMLSPGA